MRNENPQPSGSSPCHSSGIFADDSLGKFPGALSLTDINLKGTALMGRVVTEALPNGAAVSFTAGMKTSEPDASGLATTLAYQKVGDTPYFDAAGFQGRTVGLPPLKQSSR
jgi:hypothetical protein